MKGILNANRKDRMTVRRVISAKTEYGAQRETAQEVYEIVPCRLSFGTTDVSADGALPDTQYNATLFYDPMYVIRPGDEVMIWKNDQTYVGRAGEAAVYESHAETPVYIRRR